MSIDSWGKYVYFLALFSAKWGLPTGTIKPMHNKVRRKQFIFIMAQLCRSAVLRILTIFNRIRILTQINFRKISSGNFCSRKMLLSVYSWTKKLGVGFRIRIQIRSQKSGSGSESLSDRIRSDSTGSAALARLAATSYCAALAPD
jgi:hypothetical protein